MKQSVAVYKLEICLVLMFCLAICWLTIVQTVDAQSDALDSISGYVQNGTFDSRFEGEMVVTLHVFNSSYTETNVMTTTLATDGSYTFSLTDMPTDWVYMTSVTFQGLEFTSDIGRFDSESVTLGLPITVYESTNDSDGVTIDQLHVSLTFVDGQMQVSELYTFDNRQTAVYIGTTNNLENGTIQVALPEGATNPIFERGMGPASGFFPANEFFQSGKNWLDTLPLRPGSNSLTLRVSYQLPYQNELQLSHALPYDTENIVLTMPENGVSFDAAQWQQEATRSTVDNGLLRSYSRTNFDANGTINIPLSGQVETGADLQTAVSSTNPSTEWSIGIGLLLLLIAVGTRLRLTRGKGTDGSVGETAVSSHPTYQPVITQTSSKTSPSHRKRLLIAIALLDDAFEEGRLTQTAYQQKRQQLKTELISIW